MVLKMVFALTCVSSFGIIIFIFLIIGTIKYYQNKKTKKLADQLAENGMSQVVWKKFKPTTIKIR